MPDKKSEFLLDFFHTECTGKSASEITPETFRKYMYSHKDETPKHPRDLNNKFILQHAEANSEDFVSVIDILYEQATKFTLLKELETKGYQSEKYFSDSWDEDELNKYRQKFNSATVEDILSDFNTSFDELSKRYVKQESTNNGTLSFSYAGLLDISGESEEPLIEGYLLDKTFNNIIGAPKVGKSFLGYQIAFCVQNGIPFMGLPTKRADVLYIDFELRNRAINERFDMAKDFYKKPEAERFRVLNLAKTWGSDDTSLQDIVDKAAKLASEDTNLGLIIFDCYYRFAEGEENKAEDTKLTLNMLKTLTQYATVIYIHHANKGGVKTGSGAINSGSGSNVHGRIVDQSLVLDSNGLGTVTVNNTGRDFSREIQCVRDIKLGYFKSKDGLESSRPDIHVDKELAQEIRDYVEDYESSHYTGPDERTLLKTFEPKGLTKEMFRALPYKTDRNHKVTSCYVKSATE